MQPQPRTIWDSLEFRTPAMLRVIERLSDEQLRWLPPNGVNSIGWLLWHIAEVEDNWVRDKLLHVPKEYPFAVSVKAKLRLEATSDEQMDTTIEDEHYGTLTVRQVWAGVATSGAWHGGQIVYINRLMTG
jgi:hypothetical protein